MSTQYNSHGGFSQAFPIFATTSMYYCERNQIAKNENKARMMQALPILSYFHEVPTPLQSLPLSTTACHIESN